MTAKKAGQNTESATEELWDIWWNVHRSIRYHNYRLAFFEAISRLVSGINILLSTGAATFFIKEIEKDDAKFVLYLMFFLAAVNVVDLVIGTAKRSWHHRELRNKFIELEKRYLAGRSYDSVSKAEYQVICAERIGIEADEPPVYRRLDKYCHNEMVRAFISDEAEQDKLLVKLNWFKIMTMHFVRYL